MLILPAALFARFFGRCVLLTSLTTSRVLPFRNERFPRKGYWMFWAALKASHLVDALNPRIDVASLIPQARLSIAPCSFSDPERFHTSGRKTNRVVFAGHFNWQKGSDLLLEIVREWPNDPDCELVLCGSGSYESALRAAAERHSNIRIGHAWTLRDVLADAKVFFSLQQWDNYPSQSLLEAMLCECCIVATDAGDTDLLVRPPWGECLPLDASPRAYVETAMRFLRMSESCRKEAGAAARAFVVGHHTRDRYVMYLRSLWRTAAMIANGENTKL
jgi:glycosyltransferase involved in cell wall biosynthesis